MEDVLATLRERIRNAVADKVIGKILVTESRHHFNHAWKTGCTCSICEYRREYARLQALPNMYNRGHRTMEGGWFDVRYHRRELNRAFKKRVLGAT